MKIQYKVSDAYNLSSNASTLIEHVVTIKGQCMTIFGLLNQIEYKVIMNNMKMKNNVT